jgi:carboxyl-terminal processing protease
VIKDFILKFVTKVKLLIRAHGVNVVKQALNKSVCHSGNRKAIIRNRLQSRQPPTRLLQAIPCLRFAAHGMTLIQRFLKKFVVVMTFLLSPAIAAPGGLSEDSLKTLQEAWTRIQTQYVEPVTEQQLLHGALTGLVGALDPHSQFLDQKATQRLLENTVGEYAGIGIDVVPDEQRYRITKVSVQGPASKAGLRIGDVLIKIDEHDLQKLGFDKVIDLLRGEIGSAVKITVERESAKKPLTYLLQRALIKVSSVNAYWLEMGLAYFQVEQFQADTADELSDAITRLTRQHPSGIKGIVLDLRNNPGGLVPAAVQLTDYFLDHGVIVSTRSRSGEQHTEATPNLLSAAPMVVLINGGSASASEIVAGALQDHKRALLIGERSYGKGSVQTVNRLQNDTAIKLTTSLYFTPSGRSIQQSGIEPDVVVPSGTIQTTVHATKREADLNHALINREAKTTSAGTAIPVDDVQLAMALSALKGMQAWQR